MTATYDCIATTTLGSAQASVTFSTISGSYTDLVLVCNGAVTTGLVNYNCRVNSDTGSNYSRTFLSGTGSAASSGRQSNITTMVLNDYGYLDTTFRTNNVAFFMNYSNTTTYKTVLSRANNSDNGTSANVNLWRNTNAITSIEIFTSSSTFVSGSTFTLYGIKAA